MSKAKRSYLITGSTDGIGQHTALRLASLGADILIHGRNSLKIESTRNMILSKYPSCNIKTYCYDLISIQGMKDFCDDVLKTNDSLDCLINNAGIYTTERVITSDGLESTFAVNVVAPYVISILLLPLLKATEKSRILNVASTSQEEGNPKIILENLQFQHGGYSDHCSYSLSKLCIAAFSHEMALRISPIDCLIISCDPGDVDTQMLRKGWPGYQGMKISDADDEFKLASFEFNEQMHGKYFVSCKESKCNKDVYNDDLRIGLWKELEKISNILLL